MKMSRYVGAFLVSGIVLVLVLVAVPGSKAQEGLRRLDVILCNPLIDQLGMSSTWEAAKAVGVRGIEVHVEPDLTCSRVFVGRDTPYRMDSPENASKLGRDAAENGLQIPVLVAPLKLEVEQALNEGAPAWALQLIANARAVGAGLVYFPIVTDNFLQPTIDDEEFVEAAVFVLNDLVEQGRRSQVSVSIENLSVYWNRREVLNGVLSQFQDEELGLCLDPINFYWFGHPRSEVYRLVEEFIPRAFHFHAKNVSHPADKRENKREPGWKYSDNSVAVSEGDLDFERMIGLLLDGDYNGFISVEDDSLRKYEDPKKRLEVLQSDVAYLQKVVEGYLGGTSGD